MNEELKIFVEQRTATRQGTGAHRHSRFVQQSQSQQSGYRRLFSWSLLLLFVLTLFAGWLKFSNIPILPIRAVKIEGNYPHVDQMALRTTILPFLNKGFLTIDVTGLQDRLSQLPWVYTATVTRQWPNTLIIALVEQRPVARFNDQALLNGDGELFNSASEPISPQLPLFIATPAQRHLILQGYQKMSAILAPLSLQINILAVDARQSWRLQLSNGIVVLLGKLEPLRRLQYFVAAYPEVIAAKSTMISYVDLRYAQGMAVGYKR